MAARSEDRGPVEGLGLLLGLPVAAFCPFLFRGVPYLIPFLGGLGALLNPIKQTRAPVEILGSG